jgi:hypothetical protein
VSKILMPRNRSVLGRFDVHTQTSFERVIIESIVPFDMSVKVNQQKLPGLYRLCNQPLSIATSKTPASNERLRTSISCPKNRMEFNKRAVKTKK